MYLRSYPTPNPVYSNLRGQKSNIGIVKPSILQARKFNFTCKNSHIQYYGFASYREIKFKVSNIEYGMFVPSILQARKFDFMCKNSHIQYYGFASCRNIEFKVSNIEYGVFVTSILQARKFDFTETPNP
jgi:hypothetical protein